METYKERILVDEEISRGKPIIKGTRIPISVILNLLRQGSSFEEIIKKYSNLKVEDIQAVLDYAIHLTDQQTLIENAPSAKELLSRPKHFAISPQEVEKESETHQKAWLNDDS